MIVRGDHPAEGGLGALIAFMAAADATRTLRFGTQALNNDLRHPALLAHDAATLDLLSDGRLELGLGGGWSARDYTTLGIPFEPGAVRQSQLVEAITLIKQLLSGGSVTFRGTHYQIDGLDLQIPPAQHPHMPIFIGGGRKRTLTLAAHEADVVGLDARANAGVLDMASYTASAVAEKVDWVQHAASARTDSIELAILVNFVVVTTDRHQGAEQLRAQLSGYRSAGVINAVELSAEELLESPHFLIGTPREIIDTLQERRRRYGISHITFSDPMDDAVTPVVEQLAGQ
jgi:probable F420-dependent oxidoreductase